ncbi:hypothetical protein G6F22_010014 [Rhizopus arrhizus]|nr:hypothetical protein G6F22_010014 [Rhizopus arrhizus]
MGCFRLESRSPRGAIPPPFRLPNEYRRVLLCKRGTGPRRPDPGPDRGVQRRQPPDQGQPGCGHLLRREWPHSAAARRQADRAAARR